MQFEIRTRAFRQSDGLDQGCERSMDGRAQQLEPHANNLAKKSVEMDLAGDTVALILCIDRSSPYTDRPTDRHDGNNRCRGHHESGWVKRFSKLCHGVV